MIIKFWNRHIVDFFRCVGVASFFSLIERDLTGCKVENIDDPCNESIATRYFKVALSFGFIYTLMSFLIAKNVQQLISKENKRKLYTVLDTVIDLIGNTTFLALLLLWEGGSIWPREFKQLSFFWGTIVSAVLLSTVIVDNTREFLGDLYWGRVNHHQVTIPTSRKFANACFGVSRGFNFGRSLMFGVTNLMGFSSQIAAIVRYSCGLGTAAINGLLLWEYDPRVISKPKQIQENSFKKDLYRIMFYAGKVFAPVLYVANIIVNAPFTQKTQRIGFLVMFLMIASLFVLFGYDKRQKAYQRTDNAMPDTYSVDDSETKLLPSPAQTNFGSFSEQSLQPSLSIENSIERDNFDSRGDAIDTSAGVFGSNIVSDSTFFKFKTPYIESHVNNNPDYSCENRARY